MKSKAEETEKVLPWAPGRPFAARLRSSRGSSSSRESFREEEMPDREEAEDVEVRGPGELDARLASSRESRARGCRLEYGDIISSLRNSVLKEETIGLSDNLTHVGIDTGWDIQFYS